MPLALEALGEETELPSAESTPVYRALVVDDVASERMLLAQLLESLDFEICHADSGEAAIEHFERCEPDIVFMDVVMPGMGGIEATRQIKSKLGGDFVPVVFLTGLDQSKVLEDCIDAGGDDVLSKPYDMRVLRARITAMLRIRRVYSELHQLHQQMHREEEIAEQVLKTAVARDNLHIDELEVLLRPAGIFSGDVMLVGRAPNHDLHLLLGDFTGHGLAAALGALPASQVFRAMLYKGFSAPDILSGINGKLRQLLPTGLFMSAAYLVLPHDLKRLEICNCGMPDALLLSAAGDAISARVSSEGLPLGVLDRKPSDYRFTSLKPAIGDRLLLVSDGVSEACNREGEAFGDDRLQEALLNGRRGDVLPAVTASLDSFCAGAEQADDISAVVVPFETDVAKAQASPRYFKGSLFGAKQTGQWEASVTVRGGQLAGSSPIPGMVSQLSEQGLLDSARASEVLGILGALYQGALDYGLLGMDSQTRHSQRPILRREGLSQIAEGWVRIDLKLAVQPEAVRLRMRVEGSAPGFDMGRVQGDASLSRARAACHNFKLSASGSRVEAECYWPAAAAGNDQALGVSPDSRSITSR